MSLLVGVGMEVDELLLRDMENRLALLVKKEPMPVPHAPRAAFASLVTCAAITLGGRGGDVGVIGVAATGLSVIVLSVIFLAPSDTGVSVEAEE